MVARVARLGAQWAAAGFVHGVLNTDNINVTGESFDYGPWRFLPHYDPDFTAAYFDETGLYSFGRQPEALFWNLARLADCLLTLAPQARLEGALSGFGPALQEAFAKALFGRLGLRRRRGPRPTGWSRRSGGSWPRPARRSSGSSSTGTCGPASAGRAEAGPSAGHYRSEAFAPVRAALDALAPARGAARPSPISRARPARC